MISVAGLSIDRVLQPEAGAQAARERAAAEFYFDQGLETNVSDISICRRAEQISTVRNEAMPTPLHRSDPIGP